MKDTCGGRMFGGILWDSLGAIALQNASGQSWNNHGFVCVGISWAHLQGTKGDFT